MCQSDKGGGGPGCAHLSLLIFEFPLFFNNYELSAMKKNHIPVYNFSKKNKSIVCVVAQKRPLNY